MQATSKQAESSEPSQQQFGRTAGRGFSWMSASLILGKVFLFFAQIVLGWILTKEEFGVLAIVAAVAGCIKIFHDGGVPQVLVQRGNKEFQRLQGSAFWISFSFSLLGGLALAAAAPAVARFYGDDRLVALLWVLASTLPLGSPASLLRAKMQIDLRFDLISIMALGKFAIRSLGMILLAWLGYGVMCFVIPLVAIALFELVFNYCATRETPWFRAPAFRNWPALIRDAYWVVLATLFKGVARNGDYLVLGRMLPKAIVGPYYLAYLFTTQLTGLIALNLKLVLFPIMTRLVEQPERQVSAIVRTIRLLILVAAPSSMLIALTIEPFQRLILPERWADAVPLMQIFAVVSPFLIFTDVSHAAITSRGQFRFSALLTLIEAIWFIACSWLAVTIAGSNITLVAVWIFGLQITYALVANALVLRTIGVSPREFLASFLPHWLVALAAAGIAI
ncbi:MAG: oligosaccharide flippase family protein, partial [Bythopirellula sp.]